VPALLRDDDVLLLDLGNGENRFSLEWMDEVDRHLDEVEGLAGPRALVTLATGRFFSNGLVVELLSDDAYLRRVERLLARVLALPMVTVAAVQGHAFGGGAMLALAHDLRVMRADRGFWCLPETDLGLSFTPGMAALIRGRLAPQVAHEAMVTSRRYGGTDAAGAGIVEEAAPEHEVRDRAVAVGRQHAGKAGPALGETKRRLSVDALALLGRA
jgi:enoyl-CoA hydratase/carnithine racemase